MTEKATHNDSSGAHDPADAFIRGLVGLMADPGERTTPSPSTDAEAVIRDQLTENTGTHPLDSGVSGRNWEDNQETPPWERPAWDLTAEYPVQNVYHRLTERCRRDRAAVALEVALYAYGRSGDRSRDAWLTTMEGFADLPQPGPSAGRLAEWLTEANGVAEGEEPRALAERVVADLPAEVFGGTDRGQPFTFNTYNGEFATCSQVLQGTAFGGPYADYTMLQVHGGADVRGGYTAPRVYNVPPAEVMGGEYQAMCDRCGWSEAESVVDRSDVAAVRSVTIPSVADVLADPDSEGRPKAEDRAAAVVEAHDPEHSDGVHIHTADGCGGMVRWG